MRFADTETPVLVLHLHHGSLGIARSLGRLGIPVYAMGWDSVGSVASSRYFRGVTPWNFQKEGVERSVEKVLEVGETIGGRPLLLPAADDLVLMVAEHRERFLERFTFSELGAGLVKSMIDKKKLFFLATEHGIPTPGTWFPESEEDARRFAASGSFPMMLKGIDGSRLQVRTGRKMVRVDDEADLVEQYRLLADPEFPNLMIQEFIPGGDDSVWMFNGFFDDESRCLFGHTGRKLHQFPPYKGATSLGVVMPNPEVRDLTLRFAESIGYRGILDIGFRFDARDGVYKLLDPNPRIGSTFRLFVGKEGLDVVRVEYLHRTGQPIPESSLWDGRKWMVEDWEIDSFRTYRADYGMSLRSWARDVRGTRELAWLALDDPVPFFKILSTLIGRVLGRIRGRAGRAKEAAWGGSGGVSP